MYYSVLKWEEGLWQNQHTTSIILQNNEITLPVLEQIQVDLFSYIDALSYKSSFIDLIGHIWPTGHACELKADMQLCKEQYGKTINYTLLEMSYLKLFLLELR